MSAANSENYEYPVESIPAGAPSFVSEVNEFQSEYRTTTKGPVSINEHQRA